MAFYQFKTEQIVKADLHTVWNFISTSGNPKKITPPYMGFDITSGELPDKMYQGMIISYKVSPILGIKTDWLTEITHVRDFEYFVDEQRIGPYNLWHHRHFIKNTPEGVLMNDIVTYSPPFGFWGAIANSLVIKKKLKEIFAYRYLAIEQYFHQTK